MARRSELVQVAAVKTQGSGESDARQKIRAGDFSTWLESTEAVLQTRGSAADVPCGSCRGCCRSSMFIHVHPDETETLKRIPRSLLFPAPGLPKGHVLMGYDEKGQCPMLRNGDCSIYPHRPRTCRQYDCRVFAATGIEVDRASQPEIAARAVQWRFSFRTQEGHARQDMIRRAAAFLQNNRSLFPERSLPTQPGPLALVALRIHRLFSESSATGDKRIQAIVKILAARKADNAR